MASGVSGLGDKFDAIESSGTSMFNSFYNKSSSEFLQQNATLDSIVKRAEGLLQLDSWSQSIVQSLLGLLVVSLNGSPTSLSAQAVLEAYSIALDASGNSSSLTGDGGLLTDAQQAFAACVVDATRSPIKAFSIFNQNISATPSNSSSNSSSSRRAGRSLMAAGAVAAGGSGGSGTGDLSNQAIDAFGYTILYGVYNAYLKYNLYDSWNPDPKRCVGAGCTNRILSGLFVHVTHKAPFCDHSSRFLNLGPACPSPSASIKGGIGSDPFYNNISPLYNSALNASDWYNTSLAAGEINPQTKLPYGFFPHSGLPGKEDGYPLVVSSYLNSFRALRELQYIFFSGLLNAVLMKSMSLEV